MYNVAIPIWTMTNSSTFQFDSFIRGNHVYMNIWEPLVGEFLKSRKSQPTKSTSEKVVVGHVAKNMSKVVFMFLSLPHCALDFFVTGKRINHGGGYGLEIPPIFFFFFFFFLMTLERP